MVRNRAYKSNLESVWQSLRPKSDLSNPKPHCPSVKRPRQGISWIEVLQLSQVGPVFSNINQYMSPRLDETEGRLRLDRPCSADTSQPCELPLPSSQNLPNSMFSHFSPFSTTALFFSLPFPSQNPLNSHPVFLACRGNSRGLRFLLLGSYRKFGLARLEATRAREW